MSSPQDCGVIILWLILMLFPLTKSSLFFETESDQRKKGSRDFVLAVGLEARFGAVPHDSYMGSLLEPKYS